MHKKILQKDSPILRKISKNIILGEIDSPKIKKIIEEMRIALDSQNDGVAIAAPQIGYPIRIFVVSKRVEKIIRNSKKSIGSPDESEKTQTPFSDKIYINPVITKLSREKVLLEEGCLSVRYLYGKVKRSKQVIIEAHDENGKKIVVGATGLMAQIFQHEVDHLNGTLFIDKAKDIEEVPPESINAK